MGDTNYIGSIVKILERPVQRVINEETLQTKFRAQLVQFRNIQIVDLVFWDNLARDIMNTYQVNDYIMVEGYLSLPFQTDNSFIERPLKKLQITVLKIFPI